MVFSSSSRPVLGFCEGCHLRRCSGQASGRTRVSSPPGSPWWWRRLRTGHEPDRPPHHHVQAAAASHVEREGRERLNHSNAIWAHFRRATNPASAPKRRRARPATKREQIVERAKAAGDAARQGPIGFLGARSSAPRTSSDARLAKFGSADARARRAGSRDPER